MLVKFFARKAAWFKFTAVNADCPTPKTPDPATQRSVSQKGRFFNLSDSVLGLSEIRQETQRCRKNAYDGLENAYYL